MPCASSAQRGWHGLLVERYCASDVDVIAESAAILVTLHLGSSISLTQARYGQVHRGRISMGEITVTPPGEPKGWRHAQACDALCLWLDPSLIKQTAAEAGVALPERIQVLDNFGSRDRQIEQIGLSLLSELECEGFGGCAYAESLAVGLSVHLLRRYSTAGLPQQTTVTLPAFKLRRAIEYITENLHEDLTLTQIARTLCMSPYHFARGFKQATGRSPHQYLIERRVERATRLLRDTDLPITQIAHLVGCTSQSHFSVLFHRATAMTPRAFRRQSHA